MSFRVAVVCGYTPNPEFARSLLLTLNHQSISNFDCYVFASPTTAYYLEDDFIKNLNYDCHHIKLKENRGFTGNNNCAIQTAFTIHNYKYIVLVNDDTEPHKDWLDGLMKMAESSEGIGAVASKMVFYERFVTLEGETEAVQIADGRMLGVRFYGNTRFSSSYYSKRFFTNGFYQPEEDEIYSYRWTYSHFAIEVPLKPAAEEFYKLKLFVKKNEKLPKQVLKLKMGSTEIAKLVLEPDTVFYEIEVPSSVIENNWHYIIQNAGSGLTQNYSGYDIGSGEIDKGQYDSPREVEMFCGGSCLLTTKALMKAGLFTDGLFSYYEDSDLSIRIRNSGYKIVYTPESLILHYHTGTNKEWSPFFTYHAFRNKIIFAYKSFGYNAFLLSLRERWDETFQFFKLYTKSRFRNQHYKERLKLNIIILKDALIGILKFKPTPLKHEDLHI